MPQRPRRPFLPNMSRIMKREHQVLSQPSSGRLRLPAERRAGTSGLRRMMLGGALCGGFAGSFAGALLGAAIGALCSDLSLGLDGALVGGILAILAGAVYGLCLAMRERKRASQDEEAYA